MKHLGFIKTWQIAVCALAFCSSTHAASGLIDKWSGDGDANDSVGTFNGTATNVTYTTGHSNLAFNFDGDASVDFGTNAGVFATGNFTIDLWVQTTSSGPQEVLSKHNDCSGAATFDLTINHGLVSFGIGDTNGNALNVTSQNRVDDGAFHHVAVMRSGLDLLMFVDGVISGKSTGDTLIDLENLTTQDVTNSYPVYTNNITGVDGDGNPIFDTNAVLVLDDQGNPVYTTDVQLISQPASLVAGAGSCAAPFVGILDEIEIYGRALTPFEIYTVSHPGVGLAIIDQPLNQRGLAGRPIVMHLLAVGDDPITYQWQFNGFDIPGAISNNLVLDSPQTFDSGTYTVLVSNPTNDLTSRPATLTITNLATPTNGLIARWSGEGTANDSFGGHNGVTSNIRYVPGVLGTAFQFNGSSSIRCGNVVGNMGTQDFTVDFWMETTADSPAGQYGIPLVGQRPSCDATDVMQFRLMKSGSSQNYIFAELGDHRNVGNPPFNYVTAGSGLTSFHLNDGVFHHIAATRSSNVFSLYIDGTYVASAPTREPVLLDNTGSFDMGVGSCGNYFVGSLDEVEVFNRALSDSEIFNTYSPNPSVSIVRQPLTASAAENTPASLSVSAAGLDPISYQWRLNGTDIAGATTSTYSLASAQLSDAGVYTVMVSNPVATTVSAPAQLTIVPASSILPGLINRWSAEGNYMDSMGNDLFYGGQSSFAPGVSGQAWKFDGIFNIVGADFNTGQFGYNDFTWALWVRYEKDGTLLASMPAYRFSATGGLIKVQFGEGSRNFGSDWFIMDDTRAGSWLTNAPVPINDGKFHHVAVVRQATTNLLIYIDGTNALQTVMPVFNLADQWGFAFCDDYGRFPRFAGEMDEVEDYNRALTPDEVLSLYTKYANGPRADYALQELNAAMGTSFTVNAGSFSGTGPASYQWTLNGVPISGATDLTYTVSSVDASSAGIYAVTVTTPDGSIASPIARVSIQLSAGSYNGLFYLDNDVSDDSAGFITLTLDISQTFSGQILQKGNKYTISGSSAKFTSGKSVFQVNRTGKSPLTIEVSATDSTKITGIVHDATRNIPLEVHRAIYGAAKPTPQAGKYTVQLAGLSSPNAPNGHGFGNLTIAPNGQMQFIANLADDITVSQNALIANAGVWPLYVPAYGGKGSVMGWMSFTNKTGSIASGTLRWIKGAAPLSKNYKKGFATRIPAMGSTFTPSAAGLGIRLDNSSVIADGAKIYNAVNDPILATNKNAIAFSQIGTTQKGSLIVTPSTGRFKGTLFDPVRKKASAVKGIVMQNQAYAAGYFISSNLSGRVVLQHN